VNKKEKPKNLPVSVHDRLLKRAHQQHEDYHVLLTRYCLERLLYRLGQSPHRDRFILKGAMLFVLWGGQTHRPTRDLDLLGRGDNSVEEMVRVFGEICRQPVEDDGVIFLAETVRGDQFREEEEYQGVRIRLDARQGNARLRLQIDVGFGDTVLRNRSGLPTRCCWSSRRRRCWPIPARPSSPKNSRRWSCLGWPTAV
jgi:hypothetical protein